MMGLARKILGDRFAIAALQGPHQHMNIREGEPGKRNFGFGWLTNFKPEESVELHHAAIIHMIARLSDSIDHDRVFLFGFSQSVGVNFRFAFTHPKIVKGVVAVCGGIPGDWDTQGKYASGAVDVLYIGAERDQFYSPEPNPRICRVAQTTSSICGFPDVRWAARSAAGGITALSGSGSRMRATRLTLLRNAKCLPVL
jgi:phospholipase/carboxylesterase